MERYVLKKSKRPFLFNCLALMVVLPTISSIPILACSRRVPFSFNELFVADVIVRATAVKYIVSPDPKVRPAFVPDSTVEFKVEEVLKGEDVAGSIVLRGYLTDRDDYNDVPVPYTFVRPGGRRGNCVADEYKQSAQFLLF